MNLLNKITLKNLKLNKKRTIVTIIGIMLSIALICAVSSMVFSFRASLIKYEKLSGGDYHYEYQDVKEEELKIFKNNRNIESYSLTENIGYARLENSKNENKPYIYVMGFDTNALNNLGLKLIEGRLPRNDHEIVIPKHLQTNARVNYNINDTLTLKLGDRVIGEDCLNQSKPYQEEETLSIKEEKEYKIVGVIERPGIEDYSAPGYTFITYLEEQNKNQNYGVYARYTKKGLKNRNYVTASILGVDEKVYDRLANPEEEISKEEYEKLEKEMSKASFTVNENTWLIRYEATPFGDNTLKSLLVVAAIVIAIIIATSIFCIKNSFDISITEKTKQYGMLSSIGATKKQIKKNVFYEAFILGIIGIPLGILCGLLASFLLIKLSSLLLTTSLNIGLIYEFSYLSILFSIVLGIITIYLSALKSARKASKISPIVAIRNSDDIKIKSKKIKAPKIIKKVFGIGGDVSYKNLKRNKKKYRTTVISIIVCVSIFIALASFMNLAFRVVRMEYQEKTYNLSLSVDYPSNKEKGFTIDHFDYINKYATTRAANFVLLNLKYSEEYLEISPESKETESINLVLYSISKDEYQRYIKKLGLNEQEAKNKAILMDTTIHYYQKENKVKKAQVKLYSYKKGDQVQGYVEGIDEQKNKELNLEIIKTTDLVPMGLENTIYGSGIIIVSEEFFNNNCKEYMLANETTYIDSSNPDKLQDMMEKELKEYDFYINNVDLSMKQMKSFYTLVAIFLYGFITIIALIGITNIFNTITTNMELRSREFAMLKSIGMTKKEFNRMIRLESLFYGMKSLIIGIPIGLILSYLIYKGLVSGNVELAYEIPLGAILLAIIAVLLLIFCIMKYSINKINKQNTIETIRNENI